MNDDELYHMYAGLAMQAIIGKLPLLDQGIGSPPSDDEINDRCKRVAAGAHAYASAMLAFKRPT